MALLLGVILLIQLKHQSDLRLRSAKLHAEQLLPRVIQLLPNAVAIYDARLSDGVQVLAIDDPSGQRIGFAVHTSPASDHIVGFSGPTDTLLVLDAELNLLAATVLDSQDTRDHVQRVLDNRFLDNLAGQSISQLRSPSNVDAVSGATLTSLAIIDSIRNRLRPSLASAESSMVVSSLKFPDPPRIEDVQRLYPAASEVGFDSAVGLWNVTAGEQQLGSILRSAPAADNSIGYQGPTESLLAVNEADEVTGLAVGVSYDNEPYVGYVRDDRSFTKLFNGQSLTTIASIDFDEAGFEGVSGATMTSQNVARGILLAAVEYTARRTRQAAQSATESSVVWEFLRRQANLRSVSTIGLTVLGVMLGLTSWKRWSGLRLLFQLLLIGWLGLVNGDMLSQALLAGWAQNGVPFSGAFGLVCLTLVAFVVPVTTGKNVYCSHICPHGAVQQLVRNRLPWRPKMSRRADVVLKQAPLYLLAWVLLVVMLRLPFSLVDIEPFDAWLWTIAGAASLTVAILGLGLSLFVPMAYCRYGCPTGRLLEYVRQSHHGKWTHRDTAGVLLFALALVLYTVA
jgi:NosR/NirI family transcriptional regulator, nitrous oxide reductase regulator